MGANKLLKSLAQKCRTSIVPEDDYDISAAMLVIPAAAPGILSAAAIIAGTSAFPAALFSTVAAGAVTTAFSFITRSNGGPLCIVASGSMAAMAASVGAVGVDDAAHAVVLATTISALFAAAAGGIGVDIDSDRVRRFEYDFKKIFASTLGGSVLGAAVTYGAAINMPQVFASAEEQQPTSMLHIEDSASSRDFKLSDGKTATAGTNDKGERTYTLTVPQGCALTL